MTANVLKPSEVLYADLSYRLTGLLFKTHNEIGCFGREKQYADRLAVLLSEAQIAFRRECRIGDSGNIADFVIDNKIVLELKAKRFLVQDDFNQVQRYLQEAQLQLGVLVNFRSRYLKPMRVIRIDKPLQHS